MHNDYELWEKRALEEAKKGNRAMTMAICRVCHGRIPVEEWPVGWGDVRNCQCGELILSDDLDMALFGTPSRSLTGASEDNLVRAD